MILLVTGEELLASRSAKLSELWYQDQVQIEFSQAMLDEWRRSLEGLGAGPGRQP